MPHPVDKMNEKELYIKAVAKWGVPAQLLMAIEEMSELTKEILKFLRKKESNIIEELVDVEIMLEQLKLIFVSFNGKEEKYRIIREKKLRRLEGWLDEQKGAD